jgi:hypothetical protein
MLLQIDSEQDALLSICEILTEGDEFRLAWIGYCEDSAGRTIQPVAKAGSRLDFLERVENSRGNGPPGLAVRTGKPCWINDISTDPAAATGQPSPRMLAMDHASRCR